ncbi:MAG: hypothetical protein ACTSRI_08875 [Promethearchaeota archaeon]
MSEKIPVVCPICKSKKEIEIPESIIKQASQLTTISLPKGLVCNHHFQIFVDKNYKVRGYQKVDFELEPKKVEGQKVIENKLIAKKKTDDALLKDLFLEGNFLQYCPKKVQHGEEYEKKKKKISLREKKMSLKDIYEEFWEFINDDNKTFQKFIENDKRRQTKKLINGDLTKLNENQLELKIENFL